jgi:hypothetical protein
MQEKGLDRVKNVASRANIGTGQALDIQKVGELSARFCTNLMVSGTPESAVSLPSERLEIAVRQSEPRRVHREVHKTKTELHRQSVIFGAIQAGLRGRKYCSELDSRRLRLPPLWTEEGCPATYAEAYRSPAWRKRIQDEKHRFGKLYNKTPQKEREAIVQGDTGTRRTRQ